MNFIRAWFEKHKAGIDRKKIITKESISEAEKLIETLLDEMFARVFVLNPNNFKITKANGRLLKILKLREEDLIGKYCYEISHHRSSPCEAPRDICPLRETLKTCRYASAEHIHYDSQGNQRNVQVLTVPLLDKKGKISQVLHITRDLTEQKEIEKKLLVVDKEFAVIQSQLIQSEKMASIGQLAGGIAHEINNPLTGVLNNVQLIKMMLGSTGQINPDEFKEILDAVEESALRCKKITDSLLDFSHASIGEFQPVSLNLIVDKVIGLIDNEMRIQNICIQKELQENLPNVQGDSQLLQQIIVNIISNAKWAIEKKHGKPGGLVTIKTQFEPENQCSLVYISDNGIGIPEDKIGKIFEPFFSTKQVGVGTGLGLYIVSNIIRKHRGSIEVSSKLNEGATFKISLPAIVQAVKGGEKWQKEN